MSVVHETSLVYMKGKRVMNQQATFIGVDLGGTTINVGLVTREGQIITEKHSPSEVKDGVEPVLSQITTIVQELIKNVGNSSSPRAMGIGVAGKIDIKKGLLLEAFNFPNWHNVNLATELTKRIGIPVNVENDANTAALGEYFYGAGKGSNSMLMVTLGTGVGGGLIIQGKIYRGTNGMAGEFGHTTIQYNGPVCRCGRRGCVETFIGADAIVNNARSKLKSNQSSLLNKINLNKLTPKSISDAANKGDKVAIEVFKEVGTYLGIGLANVASLLNIEKIIIGGGVAKAGELILKPARETLAELTLKVPGNTIQILPAILGERAGVIGAAHLAMLRNNL